MTDIQAPGREREGRGLRVGCRNKQKGEEKKLKIPDRTKAIKRRGTGEKESLVSFRVKKKKSI